MKRFLEGSHAIAEAVKLCRPKVISAYPITPQTHIVERLSEMVANGELDAEYINVESEHSAMAACIGAQATGVRTFTATSSQGLALMWELLYIASGMRLPIVMAVANRALSSPLNIWGDWSDSIGCRDTGWIQLYAKNAQEAFDTIVQAYKISEEVSLPVMVCIDGFFLSHTSEPVDVPDDVKQFVGEYKPKLELNPENPVTQGAYATPEFYQEFKQAQQQAMDEAIKTIKKVNDLYSKKFGRAYGNGLIEEYNMPAKKVIITMGTLAGTIKHMIDNGADIGLLRIKSYRPFPREEIITSLEKAESVGVIEKDISLGFGGALYGEVKSIIEKPVTGFIAGLGGRDVRIQDIKNAIEMIGKKGTYWIGGHDE